LFILDAELDQLSTTLGTWAEGATSALTRLLG
jgi:hypothetical protein